MILNIRESVQDDIGAIESLYPEAFPDEDLLPVVHELLRTPKIVLSLVEPPYRLPAEWESAWQSQYLGDSATTCAGRLSVPPQWQQPALWLPA